ncbi:hypothetical protein M422DRAFT_277179 [Sphaerobolus stellatus SS14]|uniref:Uncharacterized protein n=1 Tax=Sphaerobolus stellatus (strain SS14) TaxID=990650 RepID=A0A0C9U0F3_SPHS4|nr:hypothetical protein M422DRAFT_277179 [Sphaerobolus stellatus SS14]
MRPTTQVHSAAVDIQEVAQRIDESALGSYMMDLFNIDFLGLCTEEDKKKHLKKLRQELLPALWECVPFMSDFTGVPEYDPFDKHRFELDEFDEKHLILYDWHTGDDHLLDVGILMQPVAHIVMHIHSEKMRLSQEGSLINKEQALRALKRSNNTKSISIDYSMTDFEDPSESSEGAYNDISSLMTISDDESCNSRSPISPLPHPPI